MMQWDQEQVISDQGLRLLYRAVLFKLSKYLQLKPGYVDLTLLLHPSLFKLLTSSISASCNKPQ